MKNSKKELKLKKDVVSALNLDEMREINGGFSSSSSSSFGGILRFSFSIIKRFSFSMSSSSSGSGSGSGSSSSGSSSSRW